MTEYKRKLIEVALPLEAINTESAREKTIRLGHPSTLHLWWARRPLATCRAVLFGSLVDDPSAHPEQFPTEAAQQAERRRLFAIVEELVKWDNINNEAVLQAARAEITRSCSGNPPPVLDPFCGGGSIPLEAQRLGLVARASDLNPVAVLITKALIEIPPMFAGRPPANPLAHAPGLGGWSGAHGLADDVRYYGRWMSERAEAALGRNYPAAPASAGRTPRTVIAWIWARTCHCPNPACGAEMPLVNSFVLRSKVTRVWMDPIVDRASRRITYRVADGDNPPPGTVDRSGARCLVCREPVPLTYVRSEGKTGRMGHQLIAIVVDGERGRTYLPPTDDHETAAAMDPPSDVPDTDLPKEALGFRTQAYGITKHRQLFTNRQLHALTTFSDLVADAHREVIKDGADRTYADAVATYLGLAIGRLANRSSSQSFWDPGGENVQQVFARNALPMIWVYAEANPFSQSSGNFIGQIGYLAEALARVPASGSGYATQLDATRALEGDRAMVCTDPPYYDNVPYADLSDFFYVWLRRCLSAYQPELFTTILVPKDRELIAEPARQGSSEAAAVFFEDGLRVAFGNVLARQLEAYPMTIFYAFKQSEEDSDGAGRASTGWETMLQALLDSNCVITGTWPVRTEQPGGLREIGRNALASSIVLVCRKRPLDAPLAARKDFLSALQAELPSALRRLQQGNIAPVDLAQAAIGPGMAVFSRYAKVIEADGSAMAVRTALGIINRVLDETLAEQEGDFDAGTRWAVAWFEQFGMSPGEFGVAETLSKAKNSAVNALVEAGIVGARANRVKLIDRDGLSSEWDPAATDRLSVWVLTQHLVWALEKGGDAAAAEMVQRVGGLAETARELAYRLYNICERKRWAKEALSYNGLVVAWPSILRIAAEQSSQAVQMSLGG